MTDKPTTIVYIEDNIQLIDIIQDILQQEGITVFGASNGNDGLQKIEEIQPDLILLDIMMPEMDGWAVYKKIKESNNTQQIPVVIVTAEAFDLDKLMGLHLAKADGYVTKPFLERELVQCIKNILNR